MALKNQYHVTYGEYSRIYSSIQFLNRIPWTKILILGRKFEVVFGRFPGEGVEFPSDF